MGLSTISEKLKKALVWLGIGFGILAIIWVLWLLLSFMWGFFFPPPPAGPDLIFGQISKPFTYNFDPRNTIFELDTPGGQFESVPDILPVYSIPSPEGRFASVENGKKIAQGGSLDSDPIKLSEFEWQWKSKKNPNKSLTVNIVNNNFIYTYDWSADTTVLTGVFKTTNEKMIEKAKAYLDTFNSKKPDLKSGSGAVLYNKLVGRDINQVSSFSEANAVRVNLMRGAVNYNNKNYPVFESNPKLSLINLLIAQKALLELNFTYWNVDFKKAGTYGLKTTQVAYNDLRTGKAFLPINSGEKFETITITKVTLGYLNPATTTIRYFQPIFSFEGEGQVNGEKKDFLAYVLAVNDEQIKQ